MIRNGGFLEATDNKVNDSLHARCLVLDDRQTRLAIVVVDSCMLPIDLCDEAKRLASEKTGIPLNCILISATHSHSAPLDFNQQGQRGEGSMLENLQPVGVGHLYGARS